MLFCSNLIFSDSSIFDTHTSYRKDVPKFCNFAYHSCCHIHHDFSHFSVHWGNFKSWEIAFVACLYKVSRKSNQRKFNFKLKLIWWWCILFAAAWTIFSICHYQYRLVLFRVTFSYWYLTSWKFEINPKTLQGPCVIMVFLNLSRIIIICIWSIVALNPFS